MKEASEKIAQMSVEDYNKKLDEEEKKIAPLAPRLCL